MQRALRIAILVAGVVLGVLLGRRALQAWSPSSADVRSQPAPDLFHYQAEVELGAVARATDDRRLGGVLALSREELDHACEGDEAALAILREYLASALIRDPARVAVDALVLPDACFEPPNPSGVCAWAASEIDAGGTLAPSAWAMMTHCPAGVAAPFFDRIDAPAERVLGFVAAREVGSPWRGPAPRLPSQYARAVFELAGDPTGHAMAELGPAGRVLQYDDAAAADALAQAYETAPDPVRRLFVAQAMDVLANPRARAIARSACESVPTLAACAETSGSETTELLYDAASYVMRRPSERARVAGLLDACAHGTSRELAGPPSTCLARLATIDWERARATASGLDADADPALGGVVRTLTQFPSVNDLTLALRTRNLLGGPRASEAAAVTVTSVMASYGRAWTLGRSGLVAFGHDRLARHLLRLGGLEDVVVDETAPMQPPGATPLALLGEATHLRATSHGDTFAVDTASDGEFYDLDAIVGLLNVVARARGANVRYLVVVDPLSYEAVVVGPPGELASAVAEGLLEVPSPTVSPPELPF